MRSGIQDKMLDVTFFQHWKYRSGVDLCIDLCRLHVGSLWTVHDLKVVKRTD